MPALKQTPIETTSVRADDRSRRPLLQKHLTLFAEGLVENVIGPILRSHKEKVEALEARIKELEAQPFIKNGGIWRHGSVYAPGDVVQFQSTRWVCTKAHTASGAPDHACWQLWSKSGPKDDFR